MNINFEYYRIFYTVAKLGNITKAAQELSISQPAISKSIKNLEEQLGGMLFVRTKRGVFLTEEGKEFYHYIKQAIELIYNAENRFTDLIHLDIGNIRIGAGATLTKSFLLPFLEQFHKQYPKINIQISTDNSKVLFSKLHQGLLDLIIVHLPYPKSPDIEIHEIATIHDGFIVGEDYKHLLGKTIPLEDLENYSLLLPAEESNARQFLNDLTQKNIGRIFQPSMSLAGYALVAEYAKHNFGIGYTTLEYIERELKNQELYLLDVSPKIPSRSIGIAYSKHNLPSFTTRKFIDLLLSNKKK